jgi:hypothetical protein
MTIKGAVLRTATGLLAAAFVVAPLTTATANADRGAPGPGILPGPGLGGVGGPASGLGVLPGLGWGLPGPGIGGFGGPGSGLGVLPGLGWGLPGPGLL